LISRRDLRISPGSLFSSASGFVVVHVINNLGGEVIEACWV